jgi:hypothetical protein
VDRRVRDLSGGSLRENLGVVRRANCFAIVDVLLLVSLEDLLEQQKEKPKKDRAL